MNKSLLLDELLTAVTLHQEASGYRRASQPCRTGDLVIATIDPAGPEYSVAGILGRVEEIVWAPAHVVKIDPMFLHGDVAVHCSAGWRTGQPVWVTAEEVRRVIKQP